MVKPPGAGTAPEAEPRQLAVYRTYLQLQSIAVRHSSGTLGGRLVLCPAFGQGGAELALATVIAGGAFLGIDPDAERLKLAVRNGACDFMVNTLDEALRVLKNEVRKQTPLSAGLVADAAEILPEMVERGVQPDLIASPAEFPFAGAAERPAIDTMQRRGAEILAEAIEIDSPAETVWTAGSQQDLRRMDADALALLAPADEVRRRWLEQAPGYFYRQRPLKRVLALDSEERVRLLDAFRRAHSAFPFQQGAAIRYGGEPAIPLA